MKTIRRVAAVLAGLTAALLAFTAAAPAAFARPVPPGGGSPGISVLHEPPGWNKHPPLPVQVHAVVVGGMPGWQIALIAIGAALVAATAAVLVDRAHTARRRAVTTVV